MLSLLRALGCPWGGDAYCAAVRADRPEILRWLHDNGCPRGGAKNVACRIAAAWGHAECLRRLHEMEWPVDASCVAAAAEKGHINCLRYLYDRGCPWDKTACEAAARGGRIERLRFLHERGCPWDVGTCKAALRGHTKYIGV